MLKNIERTLEKVIFKETLNKTNQTSQSMRI